MGIKDSRKSKRDHCVLTEDTEVGSIYNITERVKQIKKLYELSKCLNKDLTDILLYCGENGLSIEDVATLAGMPNKVIREIFSKGEVDFQEGVDSIEAEYYRAFEVGRRMCEVKLTNSAVKKDPMKMLAVINPVKYSDKVTDKYELPKVIIQFGSPEESEEDI